MTLARIVATGLFAATAACGSRQTQLETAPQTDAAPRSDSLRVQQLASGVSYQYRWYAGGPWAVHEIIIEPGACGLTLRTVKAENGRETTGSMAARVTRTSGLSVLAAINADFFSFNPPGVSEGPQVSAGTIIKSEGTHREAIEDRVVRLQPTFAWTPGRGMVAYTRTRGGVRVGMTTVGLDGVNVAIRTGTAFVFDSLWTHTTPSDDGALELIVREAGRGSWSRRGGVVIGIDTSAAGVAVPAGGFVVALRDTARARLARTAIGDSLFVTTWFDGLPRNVTELVGGYPMLLLGGKRAFEDDAGLRVSFADRRHPRSAIGISTGGRIHIFAIDGRQPGYSEGMSLTELSEYLLARGIPDALNFDGGGSTTLVVLDRVANRPSDPNGERAVSNALVVLNDGTCPTGR